MAALKDFLDKKKADLEDHKKTLDREKENNKELESNIAGEERTLTKIRESLAKHEEERNNLEGEVRHSEELTVCFRDLSCRTRGSTSPT